MTFGPVLRHLLSAPPEPLAAGDEAAGWYRAFNDRVLASWRAEASGAVPGAASGETSREASGDTSGGVLREASGEAPGAASDDVPEGPQPDGRAYFGHGLLGGFVADRPAWAMVAGHQGAIRRLAWQCGGSQLLPEGGIVAFCVSEEGGAHPRAVRASLAAAPEGGFRLNGQKRWATLAPSAAALLLVASAGREGSRNRLQALCVPSDRRGIDVGPMDLGGRVVALPEVRHAVVDLHDVPVATTELLGGDGYVDAVKPFRTIEDLYIAAAMTAWNLAVARRSGWPESAVEDLLLLLVTAEALAFGALDEPAAHLGLAAFEREIARVREAHAAHWDLVDEGTAAVWRRATSGAPVAARARELRRQAAWRRLGRSGA